VAYSIEVLASARMGARVRTCFAVEDVVGDVVFNGSWATFTEQPEKWVCTARSEVSTATRPALATPPDRSPSSTIKALTRGEAQ
jgi:hypothetical protein